MDARRPSRGGSLDRARGRRVTRVRDDIDKKWNERKAKQIRHVRTDGVVLKREADSYWIGNASRPDEDRATVRIEGGICPLKLAARS